MELVYLCTGIVGRMGLMYIMSTKHNYGIKNTFNLVNVYSPISVQLTVLKISSIKI